VLSLLYQRPDSRPFRLFKWTQPHKFRASWHPAKQFFQVILEFILHHCSSLHPQKSITKQQNVKETGRMAIWAVAPHLYQTGPAFVNLVLDRYPIIIIIIKHINKARVTTVFQQWFSMTFPWPKNEFPWPIGTAYFFEINDTRFMNVYQNKNIFPVARQSVSK